MDVYLNIKSNFQYPSSDRNSNKSNLKSNNLKQITS